MRLTSRLKTRLFPVFLGVVGLLGLTSGTAHASVTDFFDGATFSAGLWTYSYHAELSNDETANTNDFTTIYDLAGMNVASIAVTNHAGTWTPTTSLTGQNPPGVAPLHDNPGIINLTLTNTGAKVTGGGPGAPATRLFDVTFTSPLGPGSFHDFSSTSSVTSNGNPVSTYVPLGVNGPLITSPEPASLALLALALPMVGLFAARKQKV